jgi:metal-sulfur cluster biosynthetic enzyme
MDWEKVKDNLSKLRHPEIDASLEELGMIQNAREEENRVKLTLKLPFLYVPIRGMLEEMVRGAIESAGAECEIEIEEMNEAERNNFMKISQSRWIG